MNENERVTGEIDKPLLKRPSHEVLAECLYKSPGWVTHEFEWLRYDLATARKELADTIADRNNLIEQRDSVMAENERLRGNALLEFCKRPIQALPTDMHIVRLTRTMEILITQMGSASGFDPAVLLAALRGER